MNGHSISVWLWPDLDAYVGAARLRKWASRGKIKTRGYERGIALYDLHEVIDVAGLTEPPESVTM